jgi:hypothetical protein
MACKEAAVAHFGVPANHIPVKSETLPLHGTLSLTSTDESGSNDPTLKIEVALGHSTRSAQARDKEPKAHPICIKTGKKR